MNLVQVSVKEQKLYLDMKFKTLINQPSKTKLSSLKLRNGDIVYLSNENAEFAAEERKEFVKKCAHSDSETCLNCITAKTNDISEKPSESEKAGLTSNCIHKIGQKCIHCMETPNYKAGIKYNCQHDENGKCPNCVGKEFISDVKHKSFEQYLNEKKEICKGTHESSSFCNNCLPPQEIVYKLKPNCPFHMPYPQGLCIKCSPPNVNLYRQLYRLLFKIGMSTLYLL
jgi:nuclear protein localization family protein 4